MKAKNSWFLYIIRLILGCLLIYQGYKNLFPIEDFEYRLIEQHLSNWLTAPILSRILIGLHFITGLFLILKIDPHKIFIKILIGIVVLNIFDITWEILVSTKIIRSCYGCIAESNLFITILVDLVFITGAYVLLKYSDRSDLKFKWHKYLLMFLIIPLPFIFNPVFPNDFIDVSNTFSEHLDIAKVKKLNKEINYDKLIRGEKLIAFFSTSCPYCQISAKKMAVANTIGNFPSVFIIFLGDEEGVKYFFDSSNTNFEYATTQNSTDFFEISGVSLPSISYLKEGVIKKKWNGRTFNYEVIRNLSSR